jgi:hypothetical protein
MGTPTNPKRPAPDDPEQSKRFIDMAREVEADESPEKLERFFKKIASDKVGVKPKPAKAKR